MPKLQVVNDNIYRKINTGADWNRPIAVVRDKLVIVSAAQATSRLIHCGFRYTRGGHELEVYVNGVYKRRIEYINGTPHGDYTEHSNFTVLFEAGQIAQNDRVRLRVTQNSYKPQAGTDISFDAQQMAANTLAIAQLETDVAGIQANYAKTYSDTLAGGDWILSGAIYYGTITHNLNTTDILVNCWNTATQMKVVPKDIERINVNTIRVWMPVNTVSMRVVVHAKA